MKGKKYICFIALGIVFLIIGVVIYSVLPILIHKQISAMLPLEPGTLIYNQWQYPTLPVFMQFWYFNVINPDEVKAGKKPFLKQIGPYTYREQRVKENITFNANGTVSYKERKYFHFDSTKSKGKEDDIITTLNIPMLVIGNKIKNLGNIEKDIIKLILKVFENVDIVMNVSVGNITWGYLDPFLEAVVKLLPTKFRNLFNIDPHVGLFYGKNDTTDGFYTVDSGRLSLDNFLKIYSWNNSDHLNMWNTKYANEINGTDGSMFSPFLNSKPRRKRIYAFQSDLCRSIYTEFNDDKVNVKGIPAYSFVAPSSLFANSSVNPDNIGFCLDGDCLGSGVLNMSKCIPMAPVVMSQPHLYQADPKYQNKVDGLQPGPDCATQLIIEPYTGLPLHLQKKLQINIAVEPVSHFAKMDKLKAMFLPVAWVNESALIDDKLAQTVMDKLVIPTTAAGWISTILMILGPVICFTTILLYLVLSYTKVKGKQLSETTLLVNTQET